MTMLKALHPKDDVDRQYVSRKEGGRGLANIEDSEDDIEKHKGGLVTAIRNDSYNTMDNGMIITRKKNGKKNNSMDALND